MPSADPPDGPQASREGRPVPPPLVTAASLVAVEAGLLLGAGVLELAAVQRDRLGLGLSTAAFFLLAGAGLLASAWGLWRARRRARGPALLAQLITLGLAWNLRGDPTNLVAVGLAALAVVVAAGLLHPASVDALEGRAG